MDEMNQIPKTDSINIKETKTAEDLYPDFIMVGDKKNQTEENSSGFYEYLLQYMPVIGMAIIVILTGKNLESITIELCEAVLTIVIVDESVMELQLIRSISCKKNIRIIISMLLFIEGIIYTISRTGQFALQVYILKCLVAFLFIVDCLLKVATSKNNA